MGWQSDARGAGSRGLRRATTGGRTRAGGDALRAADVDNSGPAGAQHHRYINWFVAEVVHDEAAVVIGEEACLRGCFQSHWQLRREHAADLVQCRRRVAIEIRRILRHYQHEQVSLRIVGVVQQWPAVVAIDG
jgi:hypothetical protein